VKRFGTLEGNLLYSVVRPKGNVMKVAIH